MNVAAIAGGVAGGALVALGAFLLYRRRRTLRGTGQNESLVRSNFFLSSPKSKAGNGSVAAVSSVEFHNPKYSHMSTAPPAVGAPIMYGQSQLYQEPPPPPGYSRPASRSVTKRETWGQVGNPGTAMYTALHAFAAENSDELNLRAGEPVTLVQVVDQDWAVVQNMHGQTGLVPLNHVAGGSPEPPPY
jgi:hypothetical protein